MRPLLGDYARGIAHRFGADLREWIAEVTRRDAR